MPEGIEQQPISPELSQAAAQQYYTVPNDYFTTSTVSFQGSAGVSGNYVYWAQDNGLVAFQAAQNKGQINPILYFKYVKSKFKPLERVVMDSRISKVERAYKKALENGQDMLAKKFISSVAKEMKESAIFAKGIKYFIERDDLNKHKRNIRGGHISDTMFKDYTRVIPEDVVAKKKEVQEIFDDFVIYHYWNEEAQKDVKKMSSEEKAKMRDPVLFGVIKETNRLYFIADWEDEFCDLTFDELVDVVGKEKISEDVKL